jgi:hypothetical protein
LSFRLSRIGSAWRFRLSLALLLLVGLGLSLTPWQTWTPPIWADILEEMGKAFVIAFVLAIVVEGAQELKLLNEFAEHISLHIMGRKLPPQLRNHVEQYLGATFVRPNLSVRYQLEAWDGKPDRVKLTKEVRYSLENCMEDDRNYDWQYRVDDSWFSDVKATIDRMGMSNPDTKNRFQDYRGQELAKKIKPEPGGERFLESVLIRGTASYETKLAPLYEFMAESTECFPSGYSEHLTATHPVLHTELTVEYDKTEFAVSVYLPLARPDAFQDPNGTDTIHGKFWVITQPILPGQSFFTTWRKLPPAAPPALPPPVGLAAAAQTTTPRATAPTPTGGTAPA